MSMSKSEAGLTLALIARIPIAGLASFLDYEARVLPILGEHGGTLQRRLRSAGGSTEIHLVHFDTRAGFESFRDDPRRAAASHLLASSGAVTEVIEVQDVD